MNKCIKKLCRGDTRAKICFFCLSFCQVNGALFLDKRETSQFDYLTVNETAFDPPMAGEDPDNINAPERLSLEATMINQNFSQQILKSGQPKVKMSGPPFAFFTADWMFYVRTPRWSHRVVPVLEPETRRRASYGYVAQSHWICHADRHAPTLRHGSAGR